MSLMESCHILTPSCNYIGLGQQQWKHSLLSMESNRSQQTSIPWERKKKQLNGAKKERWQPKEKEESTKAKERRGREYNPTPSSFPGCSNSAAFQFCLNPQMSTFVSENLPINTNLTVKSLPAQTQSQWNDPRATSHKPSRYSLLLSG